MTRLSNGDMYKLTYKAITEHFNKKLKDMEKEKLDLYAAQDILDQCKEVQTWFDDLYNDRSKEE